MERPTGREWLAWAAGILEGEGSFVRPHAEVPRWRVQCKMTDEDVIRKLRDVFCVGRVYGPYCLPPPRKPAWVWLVDRWTDVEWVATVIYPFMGHRRRSQLDRMLEDMRASLLDEARSRGFT